MQLHHGTWQKSKEGLFHLSCFSGTRADRLTLTLSLPPTLFLNCWVPCPTGTLTLFLPCPEDNILQSLVLGDHLTKDKTLIAGRVALSKSVQQGFCTLENLELAERQKSWCSWHKSWQNNLNQCYLVLNIPPSVLTKGVSHFLERDLCILLCLSLSCSEFRLKLWCYSQV